MIFLLKAGDYIFNFARPINENTRDEFILVKYTGCIKNVGEMLYNATKSQGNGSYWMDKYPMLNELVGKSDEEAFNLLAPFTGPDFFKFLLASPNIFSVTDTPIVMRDYSNLRSLSNPYKASITNMELSLRNIASYNFCKEIYIYDVGFTDASKSYLRELFDNAKNKISLISSDIRTIILNKPEITTIITDDNNEVCDLIQSIDEEKRKETFNKKQFLISALPNIKNQENKNDRYIHQDFLTNVIPRYGCYAEWWQLKFVDRHIDDNKEVRFKNSNK